MKNKKDSFKKEKQQLFYLKIKQLVLTLIMTLIVVIGFMITLVSLIFFLKQIFN
jgi:Na+/melibiose symporter-like transporter